MPGPVLLVLDDIALISVVRRLLSRDGREVVLASSVADAIIAFGHYRPDVVLLSPKVEEGRGPLVVDELRQHPEGHPLHLLLLGESLSDVDAPVASLPLEGPALSAGIEEARRRAPIGGWTVREPLVPVEAPARGEAQDAWQARGPRGSMARRLFGSLEGAPNDTPAPELEVTQTGVSPSSYEVTQTGVRSPFHEPAVEEASETTQQTAIPEWLRAKSEPGEALAEAAELQRLRRELAQSQEAHSQARAMASALRIQARDAEAALLRQADSRNDHSPIEIDPVELEQLRDELKRSQEDARGARRSLGRAISKQKELETELELARASAPVSDAGDADDQTGALEVLRSELETLRQQDAQSKSELEALRESQRGSDAQSQSLRSLHSELEALRESQRASDAQAQSLRSLHSELEALREARRASDARSQSLQSELETVREAQRAEEAGREALEVELEQLRSIGARDGALEAAQASLQSELSALVATRATQQALAEETQRELTESLEASEAARLELEARLSAQALAYEAQHAALQEAQERLEASASQQAAMEAQLLEQQALLSASELQSAVQAQLEAQLAEAREALEAEQASRAELEARAASDRREQAHAGEALEVLRAEHARTYALQLNQAVLLEQAQAQLVAAHAASEDLRASLSAEGAAREEAQAALEALRVDVGGEAARLAEELELARQSAAEVARASEDVLAARSEAHALAEAALHEAAQSLRTALDEAEEARRASVEEFAQWRDAATRSAQLAEAALQEQEAESARIEAALADAGDRARAWQEKLAEAEAALASSAQDLLEERSRRAELEALGARATAQVGDEAQATIDRLTAEVAALEVTALAEHEALTEQLAAVQANQLALQEELAASVAALQAQRLTLQGELATAVAAEQARRLALEEELAASVAALHARRLTLRDELASAVAEEQAGRLAAEAELAQTVAALQAQRVSLQGELGAAVALEQARRLAMEAELAQTVAALHAQRVSLQGDLATAVAAEQARRLEVEAELAASVAAVQAQRLTLQDALADAVAAEQARRLAVESELAALVAAEQAHRIALEEELAEARLALAASGAETGRLRAEQETILARAVGAVGVVVGETAEGAGGPLDRSRLISLLTELHKSRPEARLEVRTSEALRVLFFREGTLVGATSTAPGETLLDRARRDGLIDGRQEAELRLLRGVSSGDLLRALRERGFLRENEVLPLVQRHTEQLALEVFSQSDALFRLSLERTPAGLVLAAAVRPPLVLLTEALRAATPAEGLLSSLGGLSAGVRPRSGSLGLGDLGLRDPELALLRRAEVPTTVEQLLLGSGMRQEVALRTLALARAFGLIELEPGEEDAVDDAPADDLEVRRLASKFDEVQDADYFTVLGLPRNAGGAEVRRAFDLLSSEFHPLRFAGHPDPLLQRRAQAVQELLSEALQALEDDRLRAAYARNLRD